tara:strand:- start:54278 stop:55741 length:1464 start_codon:yes stop_codon:yes gene_type:complete
MIGNKIYKQVFWFNIISYTGVAIGVISTVFIYPHNKEFLGIVRYVDSLAQLLFPLILFGGGQALVHFYPTLDEYNRPQLFKYSIASILVISFVLLSILLLGTTFSQWNHYYYFFYAFPIASVLAFVELFKRQAIHIDKIEIPALYEKIIPKIALPTIFGLLIFGYLNIDSALLAFVISYFILFVLLLFYILKHFKLKWGFKFKSLFSEVHKKEYYKYSFFSFLGSFGSILAFRIDAFMIPEFLSFEANGTFAIGMALATSLAIPAAGVFAIYAPKISAYLKNNEIDELGKKYKETAKLLFFIGAVVYTSLVLGIDSLFKMLPAYDKLVDSIPIIILLGANVVFNMSTGFNNEIISYSKYYRFNIISVLSLAILNIFLNIFFLTQTNLGIIGVAYASLIAMVSFNCIKLLYIHIKLGILPFDKDYFKILAVVCIVFFTFLLLPVNSNPLFNLILKSGLNSLLILYITYRLKLIYSLNYWVAKLYKQSH